MNKKLLIVLILAVVASAGGFFVYKNNVPGQENLGPEAQKTEETVPAEVSEENVAPVPENKSAENTQSSGQSFSVQKEVKAPAWQYGGLALGGAFADADIVKLADGSLRMYYSEEPETPGFEGKVYSAVSQDGKSWTKESGVRRTWSTFPSVIQLSDGRYRMYFQNAGIIKSAVSPDGLSWTEEAGIRIDTANAEGLVLENVAAPTVMKVGNEYVMVYRGTINQKYPAMVPNSTTQLFFWAVSSDGLFFEKKGMALDSRNSVFNGLLDGPELVLWDDGSVRLYFWSYKGVYHAVFENGKFSTNTQFDYTNASNPNVPFPENPPSDPTLIQAGGKWFLYYGQHTKGIYYAIFE